MKDYIEKIKHTGRQVEESARAVRRLSDVLEKGPHVGLIRTGPGLAGIRTVCL